MTAFMAVTLASTAPLETKQECAAKERALISLLQSNAPPADKAAACKKLTVYGTKDAVPALAVLLYDPSLASWARIPLEAIPGSAPDAALRKAMGKLDGRLLVGTINSIGVRRDPKAVSGLIKHLHDNDPEVASAAAIALGRIGGSKAAKALRQSLTQAPTDVRSAVAQGCVLCAEKFCSSGKPTEAVKLYDAVRVAPVPKQRVLEATRGAILARGPQGLPLLLEQLRSPDRDLFRIGLSTARELPGVEVTQALAAELGQSSPDRQPMLLLAISDRTDAVALATVMNAAKAGPTKLRLVAVGALDRQGNIASVPVLLQAATSGEPDLTSAALGALTRLPGSDVDADLVARLNQSSGKTRQALLELAGRRRLESALPVIVTCTEDSDTGIRRAAVQTIVAIGDDKQMAALVRLLQPQLAAEERADVETALIAIGSRTGARAVPSLLPLAQNTDSTLRIVALHGLASAGGPDALTAVKTAVQDTDENVRDEAVRTLATWPNNWPEDSAVAAPLLDLAKYSKKNSHQVLGLRGYLQYLQGDKQLKDDQKVTGVRDVLPLIKRPEEQRLAIGVVSAIPTPAGLALLVEFTSDAATADDACSAIVKLAGDKAAAIPKEARRQALQKVAEKSTQDGTKHKAEDILKGL